MRPTWLEFGAKEAGRNDGAYLLGRNLLVKPITAPGVATERVALPSSGERWYPFRPLDPAWGGKWVEGGGEVEVDCGVDDGIPVWARGGGVIAVSAHDDTHTLKQNDNSTRTIAISYYTGKGWELNQVCVPPTASQKGDKFCKYAKLREGVKGGSST
jgi:alpha-glucosidase (family GH31 glycosyl hydrolase)